MATVVPEKLCQEVLTSIDGALAFALVDLHTGLPLAMDVGPTVTFDPAAAEMLAALGVSYFQGGASADEPDNDLIHEIQATTEEAYLFMVRIPDEPNELAVLAIDRNATNLGLGWMATRQAVERIRALGTEDARRIDDFPVSGRSLRPAPVRTPARTRRTRRSIWD